MEGADKREQSHWRLDVPNGARLRQLLGRDYDNSVFRRTIILLSFLLPAFSANFAVLYFTTAWLPPAEFGIFYVASTFGNVLFSGSLILNMFFSRHLISVTQVAGEDAAFATVTRIERAVISWGAVFAVTVLAVMLTLSRRFGVQSWPVIVLMTLDAYTAYVADIGRALLQSLRRTLLLGTYTLVWMVLRLAFCLLGVLVLGTASGALLGVITSAVVAYVGFRLWVVKLGSGNPIKPPALPSPVTLLPAILGYGLLMAISNLDILLSYVLLKDGNLGVYSASSIFPKAMLVVTMPVLQILFPAMVGAKPLDQQSRKFVRKSGVAMAVITTAGVTAIGLLSGWLCGGRWGVKLCDPSLMYVLLVSVVPLSLLRVLVLLQFARRRDWFVLWLGVPTTAYLWAVASRGWNLETMAAGFSVFSAAAFTFFLCIHFGANRLKYRLTA